MIIVFKSCRSTYLSKAVFRTGAPAERHNLGVRPTSDAIACSVSLRSSPSA